MKTHGLLAGLATVALASALSPSPASAATSNRAITQLATGICGANNPANDVYLRRLPTGLKNAGANNISVVCSLWGDDGTAQAATSMWVYFRNDKNVAGKVYCTLAMGVPEYSQVVVTGSIIVPAASSASFYYDTDDYGTSIDKQWVNLQCSLPPGYSMREVAMMYDEDIGT
jgi:hypothetical protein